MKAVVLAAGEGTRLRPLTFIRPKPLTTLGPEPSVYYLMSHLAKEGFDDIVVIAGGSQKIQVMNYLGDGSKFGVKITYAVKPDEYYSGTAGSLRLAEHLLNETFLVAQADTLTEIPLAEAVDFHKRSGAPATIVLTRVEDPSQFGVVVLGENNEIVGFQEKPKPGEAKSNLVSTGFYILEPSSLDYIIDEKFDFAKDLFPRLLSLHKKIMGFVSDAFWVDIGSIEGYLAGVRWVLDQLTSESGGGVINEDRLNRVIVDEKAYIGHNVRITGPVLIEEGVTIEDGATIGQNTLIKSNCLISSGALIEGSVIMENSVIGIDCEVLDSVIGGSATLGDNVIVRRAVVGAGATVDRRTKLLEGASTWPNAHVGAGEVVKGRVEVPLENAFYFYKDFGQYTGVLTRSVEGMVEALEKIPSESIEFHTKRRDLERWARDTIGSNELADEFEKIRLGGATGEELRSEYIMVAESFAGDVRSPEKPITGSQMELPTAWRMLSHMRSYMKIAKELANKDYPVPSSFGDEVSNIVFLGMGGSGVVGDIVKDMTESHVTKPIFVRRRSDLPAFVDVGSLVFAVSYSGNTFETLAALQEALARGCKVIGITSGGKMKEVLSEHGMPCIDLPTGYQPREALPFMLFPVLRILGQLGWPTEEVDVDGLDSLREDIENLAMQTAPKLVGKASIIYTEYPSVGHRIKSQLNENAKAPARYDVATELFHNEVNAWKNLKNSYTIMFRERAEDKGVWETFEIAKTLLDPSKYTEIEAVGTNKSTRIMYMIWFGDFLSFYLAKENGVDPVEVPVIDYLKSELSLRRGELSSEDEDTGAPPVVEPTHP